MYVEEAIFLQFAFLAMNNVVRGKSQILPIDELSKDCLLYLIQPKVCTPETNTIL